MPTYIAMLRAVNVGGNVLKMERLRAICNDMGLFNVRTYLQSGNVVFQAKRTASALEKAMEEKLIGETRLPVSVIIRTPDQLKRVIQANPFPCDSLQTGKNKSEAQARTKTRPPSPSAVARLYVAFLSSIPDPQAVQKLSTLKVIDEQFHVNAGEVYLYLPQGAANSKITNNLLEKILVVRATTRNWNTVNNLYEMALA